MNEASLLGFKTAPKSNNPSDSLPIFGNFFGDVTCSSSEVRVDYKSIPTDSTPLQDP